MACNSIGFNDRILMNVSISLEMWIQCGPSHVKCGSTTSPQFECGCNVDVLWSNVDFHISNVNKCTYIAGQNNGDLRSFFDKYELYVDRHT